MKSTCVCSSGTMDMEVDMEFWLLGGLVSRASVTKYHQVGMSTNRNRSSHGPGSPRGRCSQGGLLLKAVRGNPARPSSLAC